jgi:hypothetical protein
MPPTVKQFIQIANGVPKPKPDPTFPGLNEDPLWEALQTAAESDRIDPIRQKAILTNVVEVSWLGGAKAYVLEAKGYSAMIDRYQTGVAIRDLLDAIASQNSTDQHPGARTRIYSLPQSGDLLSRLALRMVENSNEECRTKRREMTAAIVPSEPLRQFLEEVELDRIKRCGHEKCGNLFWAGRVDKPCCSETCRNAYKQKKHRESAKANLPYKKGLSSKGSTKK